MNITRLNRWLNFQAIIWLLYLAFAVFSMKGDWHESRYLLLPVVIMAASYVALWKRLGPIPTVADRVTLARFLATLLLLSAVAIHGTLTWGLWLLWVVTASTDLIDGYCARRFGGSEAGAVLDMETDQFTTLGLALAVANSKDVGPFVLALPALRYVYVLFARALGFPAHDPNPRGGENVRGKLVCAMVIIILLACSMPSGSATFKAAAGWIAVALLVFSFGSDFLFLGRRRAAQRASSR